MRHSAANGASSLDGAVLPERPSVEIYVNAAPTSTCTAQSAVPRQAPARLPLPREDGRALPRRRVV